VTGSIELIVFEDQDQLSSSAAHRLLARIATLQSQGRPVRLGLTGGRGGTGVLAAMHRAAVDTPVDWSMIELWWSDERFLPAGDPERNETGARQALLDLVPLNPALVHPMPASDGPDADVDAAARRYAAEIPEFGDAWLDVCLLGIGEDAHVASLFPGRSEAMEPGSVVAVRDSPKPPPIRTTFTMKVIRASDEVWLIAAGEGKAEAVKRTLSDLPLMDAPAGSARGRSRTLLFADEAAAGLVAGPGR